VPILLCANVCLTGLFHKAICQSGVITVPWAFTEQDDAINNGLMLAQKLGNVTSDPNVALKFLKDINGSKLIETKVFLTHYYDYCNNNFR